MKNKIINILTVILILVLSTFLVFSEEIGDLDELWQYSFANNLCNGLVPYRDFNIITTPLFSFVAAIFLKIFSNQLITMRLFNLLVFSSILFIAYKIFELLKMDKIKSLLCVIILYFLFYFDLGVEYNYFILLITLIFLYFELYNINKYGVFNLKCNVALGILIGLTIITKHTIGFILSFMFIFYKILLIHNKNDWLIIKKIIIQRILGVLIPCILLLIYLLLNDALYDCIDYCILGILEFKNKVSYLDLFFNRNILIGLFAFIVPIFLLSTIALFKYRKNNKFTIILIMLIYSIMMFIGMFPIANSGHFIIYAFIGIMTSLYIIYIIIKKLIKNKKIKIFINTFIKYAIVLFLLFYVSKNSLVLIKLYKNNNICKNELEHYYGILINENMIRHVSTVDNYILQKKEEGKKVYILDASAVMYVIPINIYNKNYDMFNKGNLGKNGEEKLINEIQEAENTIYLLLKDEYSKNWQTPLEVIDFVKNNKSKIGEIEIFDIYE